MSLVTILFLQGYSQVIAQVNPPNDLVAWYPFDGVALDISGNKLHIIDRIGFPNYSIARVSS